LKNGPGKPEITKSANSPAWTAVAKLTARAIPTLQVSDQKHLVFATAGQGLAAELKDGALFGRSEQAIRSSVGAYAGPGIFRFQRATIMPPETGRPGDYQKPDGGCKRSEGMGAEESEQAVRVRKEKIIPAAGEPDG
jgi:hypothetical protein